MQWIVYMFSTVSQSYHPVGLVHANTKAEARRKAAKKYSGTVQVIKR